MKEKVFRLKTLIYGVIITGCALFRTVNAQESISGIINTYAVVKQISNSNPNDQDTITINDTTGLGLRKQGGILIMQMKGADVTGSGTIQDINSTGLYEFILIREFLPGNKIILARNLLNNYDVTEKVQLVSVPFYDYVIVNSTLTCLPWNDSTGGVLAIVVFDTLKMLANIDASNCGYRGFIADPNTGNCGNLLYDYIESSTLAGRKGESFATVTYNKPKGGGRVCNGGGGDYGAYSGGGGGANYGHGGLGGVEIDTCNTVFSGKGGYCDEDLNDMYNVKYPRAFMGGGGGGPTLHGTNLTYKAGNGGGIVIIVSSHIIGNNYKIMANGESVQAGAETGGSGGGAGGSIILAVDTITNAIRIEAKGGMGGSVSHPTYCTGAGGGGGGGVLWHAWPNFKANSYIPNLDGGNGGSLKTGCNPVFVGVSGSDGATLDSLNVPLNGFLFNVMPPDQAICEGETPEKIVASHPKGGDGMYVYIWEEKTKLTSWGPATGTNDQKYFSPPSLTDTTYYRRIVQSGSGNEFVSDTSFTLTINVHPSIQTNAIATDQVICYNDIPQSLTGSNPTGGVGIYGLQWEVSIDNNDFDDITGENNSNYAPGALTDTMYYRRWVNSGVCVDSSNVVTITVLPPIQNNTILANQEICKFTTPKLLTGGDGQGGNGSYKYQWESNTNNAGWDSITYTSGNTGYNPPSLSDSTTYRRIVRSGANDLCKDTSNVIAIDVLPLITNNSISGGDTVCQYISPENFTGTQAGGGNGTHVYQWIWSADETTWDSVITITEYSTYNPGGLMESGFFKRVARSGLNHCCKDTSNYIWVKVYPAIINNILSSDQEICLGNDIDTIIGGTPGGGDGIYAFAWETKTSSTNWTILSVSDSLYQPDAPNSSGIYYYRRNITSNVCNNSSDSLTVNILPVIEDNTISDDQTTCYNTVPDSITGSSPTGGTDTSYTYQWLSSINTESWSITDGTNQFYNPPSLTVPTYFKRVVFSGLNNCCSDTSIYNTVSIWDLPTASLTANTNPDTTCAADTVNLEFILTGASPWTIILNDGTSPLEVSVDQSNPSLHIYPTYTSLYELDSVIDNNGCIATDMSGSVQIVVYDVPVPNPGPDTSVCGLTIDLEAIPSYGSGEWLCNAGTFNSNTSPTTTFTSEAYGEKTIQWKEANWKCIRDEEKKVTFFEQPAQPNAGDDIDVYGKLTTNLNADPASAGFGTWSKLTGHGHISQINDPASEVDSLIMGSTLSIIWTVDNDVCIALSDTVDIFTHPVTIPTGFSPNNGDNINQYFKINGIENFSNSHLKIFTRWGTIILDVENYQNDWAGTGPNGEDLPEDTYFYIFTGTTIYGDNIEPQKDFFVIKR